MPPITITLTETEVTHVQELLQSDSESWGYLPTSEYGPIFIELNQGILEKLKDA